MHSGQIFVKTLLPTRTNCSLDFRTQPKIVKYFHTFCNNQNSFREVRNLRELTNKFRQFFEYNNFMTGVRYGINFVPKKLKNESVKCVKTWTRQCECVSAQQLRRGQQMLTLYTKLWGERALNEFFRHMRQRIIKHGKQFIIGAVGVSIFDWDKNRITDTEIISHICDFEYIDMLKGNQISCKGCNRRVLTGIEDPNIQYCKCPVSETNKNASLKWEPYLQRDNLLVWRRQRENGCFEYKVYGKYNDVTAIDFLKVQIDINYRKIWDTNAVVLDVVEAESTSNSDIIYWEMLWPRFFANRDYVFNRRYLIEESENVLFLFNKSTEHPNVPAQSGKYRITDYFSCMVIRPTSKMDEPGIEFSLTYYDNPGVNIPSAITSWVAMAAMPEFLEKLRIAAKEYKSYCEKIDKSVTKNLCDTDLVVTPPNPNAQPNPTPQPNPTKISTDNARDIPNEILNDSDSKSSYWRYLHPHYYFG